MLDDLQDEQQRAFALAYYLHPDRDVAFYVVVEAYDWRTQLAACEVKRSTTQERRWAARDEHEPAPRSYKPTLPVGSLLQLAVYHASNRWERDQESPAPQLQPTYRPTPEQVLIRYIKELVWQTMTRRAAYTAVALGCCLYTYRPGEMSRVMVQPDDHLRRVKRRVLAMIQDRFPGLVEQATVRLRPPTCAEERRLVSEALGAFRPWTPHIPQPRPDASIWETYFTDTKFSDLAERCKSHALIDPQCAGLARLIDEYTRRVNDVPFDAPDSKLSIPLLRASGSLPPGSPFRPEPLSARERAHIAYALTRNRDRRRSFRAGSLVVYVDGHEKVRLGPSPSSWPAFAVPADASYIEVVGQDAEGPLLLAVFPVPALPSGEAGAEHHVVVQAEGGQTIEMVVRPGQGDPGEVSVYRIQITYEDAQRQVVPQATAWRALLDHGVGDRLARWLSPPWVPQGTGELATAQDTPTQTQVFTLPEEEGEITITCDWRAASRTIPATLRVAWRANLPPSEIWLRFTDPATAIVLAEVRLGSALADEVVFTETELGFNPCSTPWALAILLKDLPA
jgi:hypothetical protein